MSFPSVPEVSRKSVDKAGQILASTEVGSDDYDAAVSIVNAWRVCHAYPINTFVATLRVKTRKHKDAIVAQRLKRLQAISAKLKRKGNEHMKLSQMQDIGGVRAILENVEKVRDLQNEYSDPKRFSHELIEINDYIAKPKKDGYRGVHLVFKYNNTLDRTGKAAQYKGLRVELQIRTKWQHQWATAVETVGTMRGEALKSMEGDKRWRELFAYISSAFAIAEDSPVTETHGEMTTRQVFDKIKALSKELDAVDKIAGWSQAVNIIQKHKDELKAHFLLIMLDSKEHTVAVRGYSKLKLTDASKEYARLEKQNELDPTKNIVMVSIGRINSLKNAYPNYFLDTHDFLSKLEAIVETVETSGV